MASSAKLKANERRAICGICAAGCWVIVTYDSNGKLANVRADETSGHGAICRVGLHSPEIVYSKDRLRYPMRRKGPKGTFDFERISWDQAYDEIVSNLHRIKAESGPEATAVYTGSGSFELAFCDLFQPKGVAVSSAASVLFPFGSPNTLGVGALCYVSFAMIAPHVTMGGLYIDMFTDIENAELILIWGKNPAAHCPPHDFHRIEAAHKRGAKLIVIDPRKTAMAKYPGAEWIPIRPGTDGALALALCNELIEQELYDEEFVEKWTEGFEDFSRYVQHFRPDYVEGITGVPAETIRRLAREVARADGVAPVMYTGLEYSVGAVQAIRAVFTFWALAGQLDRPGGHCFSMRENKFPISREGLIANPDPKKAAGHNNFPIYTKYRGEFHANILPEAVLDKKPYPIRLLLSLGANIIASWPQSQLWRETLAGLDFFASVDRQLTHDSAYADIVLPAATYYEIDSYMTYGPLFRLREKVIEPVGEARSDFLIFAELADRLGYGHLYPQSSEEILQRALNGSGFSPEEVREAGGLVQIPTTMMQYKKWEKGLLRPDGKPGFDTPSGKFEIASSILDEHGYDALPLYTEPGESPQSRPDLAEHYPLVFNSGARSKVDLHTLHLTIPALAKDKPVPTVMINEDDAKERGIAQGDRVNLKTLRGSVPMYAIVTPGIVKGSIEASGMGGGPHGSEAWRKACVNDLTDLKQYDPISGFPVYKALLCQVEKAAEGGSAEVSDGGEYQRQEGQAAAAPPRRIYLDYNTTTPLAAEVKAAMHEALDICGDPSSLYDAGKIARTAVEDARRRVALLVGSTARRLVFTSGGTEANNLAVKGVALANPHRKTIITSAVEHPSIIRACQWLEGRGYRVMVLPVDEEGLVDPNELREMISDETCLVSIIHANNETGTIQPIAELAAICREQGVWFHTDAVQAAGKLPVDVEELGVDLLTVSAHKMRGPMGVGALYVRKGVKFDPLFHGGFQEKRQRAGAENVPGIVGFGKAAELAVDSMQEMEHVCILRDRLGAGLRKLVPDLTRNGHPELCLPNTLNVTLPGVRGESMVLSLDRFGIAAASGSACRAESPEPSHALMAMGLHEEQAHCSVRFSLGWDSTQEDIDGLLDAMKKIIHDQKESVRFVSCR
jgi:cysteine desulfurase NifS